MRVLRVFSLTLFPALLGCSLLVDQRLDDKRADGDGGWDVGDASIDPVEPEPDDPDDAARDAGGRPSARDGAIQPGGDGGAPDGGAATPDGGAPSDAAAPSVKADVEMCAGTRHVCMLSLDSGKVLCWGVDAQGAITLGQDGKRFQRIACGITHTCGVTREGTLACVGYPGLNRAPVPTGNDFVSVAAGEGHGCGLRKDGSLACWTQQDSAAVTPPVATDRYRAIAAGAGFTCGVLRDDGSLKCWGTPFSGSLSTPMPPVTGAVDVRAGSYQGCVIQADRTAQCWGRGAAGVSRLKDVVQLSVSGDYHAEPNPLLNACALLEGGRVSCWHGQGPVAVSGGPYVAVAAGPSSTCTLSAAGKLACTVDPGYEVLVNTLPSDEDVAAFLSERSTP